jgi:hypothetical protein
MVELKFEPLSQAGLVRSDEKLHGWTYHLGPKTINFRGEARLTNSRTPRAVSHRAARFVV